MQEREMKLWDPRQLEKPVARVRIDTGTGVLMPFYDIDTNLLFLGGKGDKSVRYYEIDTAAKPFVHPINHTALHDTTVGMALLPKKECNVSKCEVAKVLNLTRYGKFCELRIPLTGEQEID